MKQEKCFRLLALNFARAFKHTSELKVILKKGRIPPGAAAAKISENFF